MAADATSTQSIEAAESLLSQLGEPEQVHRVKSSILRTAWLVALAGLGPAAMAFYFLWQPFGTNPPPREVMVIGGSAFVAMSVILAGLALWVRPLKYLVFPEALVQMHHGKTTLFRWDDISEVFEGGTAASRYRILAAGRKHTIVSIVQHHQELGDTIVSRVTDRIVPQAQRVFEKGGAIAFGPLSISPDLLIYKDKQLAWSQIGRMEIIYNPQMKNTQLEVRLDGQLRTWCSVPVRTIPNLRVFAALVQRAYPSFPGMSGSG
jgi:uncharacterized protein DUF6585